MRSLRRRCEGFRRRGPSPGAAPQFGNRPYHRRIRINGGGSFTNDPYGMFARRRDGNTREGQPPVVRYGGRARFAFVGAVREPPVLKGRQSKSWIPAFAGMTAGDAPYGGERGVCDFVGAPPPRSRPTIREPPVFI